MSYLLLHTVLCIQLRLNNSSSLCISGNESRITDVASGKGIKGEMRKALVMPGRKFGEDAMTFQVTLKPHSFKAFKF